MGPRDPVGQSGDAIGGNAADDGRRPEGLKIFGYGGSRTPDLMVRSHRL